MKLEASAATAQMTDGASPKDETDDDGGPDVQEDPYCQPGRDCLPGDKDGAQDGDFDGRGLFRR